MEGKALGMVLCVCAGLCTGIGAAAVFFKKLVQVHSTAVLASGLGFSCGVMLYVSFVEILQKSIEAFAEAAAKDETVELWWDNSTAPAVWHPVDDDAFTAPAGALTQTMVKTNMDGDGLSYFYATLCFFMGILITRLIEAVVMFLQSFTDGSVPVCTHGHSHGGAHGSQVQPAGAPAVAEGDAEQQAQTDKKASDDEALGKMGLLTAVAIALHNFPEGLATYVATVADPSVGVMLAIAIGVHNVPEGLAVAVPVYYKSGNRWKAFAWGMFSGITEPLGGLFGYVVLSGDINPNVYGALFGIVAGIMVDICMHELMPTAQRYDPADKYATTSILVGMLVMAASLCLFNA